MTLVHTRQGLGLAILVGTACGLHIDQARSSLDRDTAPQVTTADAKELVAGNTAFAVSLFKAVRGPKNATIAPYSVSKSMAMVLAGARGDTEAGIVTAAHFSLPQPRLHPAFDQLDLEVTIHGNESDSRLLEADAIWAQRNFELEPQFLDTLAVNYGAGVNLVDFATQPSDARDTINAWIAEQTDNRITNSLSQVDPATKLVLTSTVYFEGAWETPFDESNTHPAPFVLGDGTKVDVATMNGGGIRGSRVDTDEYVAGEIPYAGALSMVVVMPKAQPLDTFVEDLDGLKLQAILDGLEEADELEVVLPKFAFSFAQGLAQPLSSLGMGSAFGDDADFSGMHAGGGIKLSEVIHQTFIMVNETGTVAAATTDPVFTVTGKELVTIDRPFLFLIRDRGTGAILFLGQVTDPR